jgi:hypothetical protein
MREGYLESSNKVSVLLGSGDGTFQAAVHYGVGSYPEDVAIEDLDCDGHPDLAVANSSSNSISVLLADGDGTFQTAVNYWAGSNPGSLAVGDFNGDGGPDLAVSNTHSNTAYYRFSPPIADYITQRAWLRAVVRTLLVPVVGFVSLLL